MSNHYPDLYIGLTEGQRDRLDDIFVQFQVDGWIPDRQLVDIICAYTRGDIDQGQWLELENDYLAKLGDLNPETHG
jgi:hypothetical protein